MSDLVSEVAPSSAAADGGAPSQRGGDELQQSGEVTLADETTRREEAPPAASVVQQAVSEPTARTALAPNTDAKEHAVVDQGVIMLREIAALKAEQKKAREAKRVVASQLRNAERRRKRLKQRASKLSDQDLLAVMSLRTHEKAMGRQVRADAAEEEDLDDSDSDLDETPMDAGSSAASNASPSQGKKRVRRS